MITMDVVLAFLAASVLVTVAPGPDNLMVLSVGISRGRSAGVGFGLGCALGCFLHTLWATLGIGALILASESAFTALKMAGAAYLAYIGVMSWRHAGKIALQKLEQGRDGAIWIHVRRGFVANAINPKVALFFIAFLPQFVDPARGVVWPQMLLLGALVRGADGDHFRQPRLVRREYRQAFAAAAEARRLARSLRRDDFHRPGAASGDNGTIGLDLPKRCHAVAPAPTFAPA